MPNERTEKTNQFQKEALVFLKFLGYKDGDRVYIRLIAGKGFDIQADKLYPFEGYLTIKGDNFSFTRYNSRSRVDKGETLERFTREDGYQYLFRENQKGYGVYLVVNPGGRKDEEITHCNSLFFECDDIGKSEQWERQSRLPFPPTLVIETRNSLHTYYRLAQTQKEGWRSLQQRLIQLMESDPSIHNESRLMRLAGFYHQKKGLEPELIKIVAKNDAVYSRSQFEKILPQWDSDRWSEAREQVDPEVLTCIIHERIEKKLESLMPSQT